MGPENAKRGCWSFSPVSSEAPIDQTVLRPRVLNRLTDQAT